MRAICRLSLAPFTALVLALCVSLLSVAPAHAGKALFGTRDYLNKLQNVDIKGANGEALYLGHKYSRHSFILPYRLTDDGYILGLRDDSRRYYELDPARIADLQRGGLLPKPLPKYEIEPIDYILGYSAWPALVAIIVITVVSQHRNRRHQAAVPHIANAVEHHQAGRSEEALAEYTRALAIHGENTVALINRGRLLEAMGQTDAAVTDYSRAIKAAPKHAEALICRGLVFQRVGNIERALSDFDRAVKASKAAVAYQARASANFHRGNMEEALKDLSAAIHKEPRAAILYAQRGEVHERLGNAKEAAADRANAERLAAEMAAVPPAATPVAA